MKKFLLGTTALIAAGAFVGAAQAGDDEMMAGPVTVGIAGYTTSAIGFASDSDDETRGVGIDYVFEFGVSGSTTLDNGITVAVYAQLGRSAGGGADGDFDAEGRAIPMSGNGTSEADKVFDEQHITMSGSFGSLRIGRTESAAFNATVPAPGAGIGGMLGVNYVWFNTATTAVNTFHNSALGSEDAVKLVYTTPNFNGLTIGMSYAPEDGEDAFAGRGTANSYVNAKGVVVADMSEHSALGVTYSTDFMEGGSLTLGAGYEMAVNESGGDDPSAMRAGLNISVDQLSFGGSMLDADPGGMQYDIGASWTEGATELGLQFGNDDGGGTSMSALHLTYTLGPGVLVGGQIAAADDVTQFMLGTAVFF